MSLHSLVHLKIPQLQAIYSYNSCKYKCTSTVCYKQIPNSLRHWKYFTYPKYWPSWFPSIALEATPFQPVLDWVAVPSAAILISLPTSSLGFPGYVNSNKISISHEINFQKCTSGYAIVKLCILRWILAPKLKAAKLWKSKISYGIHNLGFSLNSP